MKGTKEGKKKEARREREEDRRREHTFFRREYRGEVRKYSLTLKLMEERST